MSKSADERLEQLRERAEERMEKYVQDPSLLDDLPDVSDEFLSPEVGQLLAEWHAGNFDFRSLFRLSTENRQAFFQAVKEEWGVEINIEQEAYDRKKVAD